jgi:hypothetical protein
VAVSAHGDGVRLLFLGAAHDLRRRVTKADPGLHARPARGQALGLLLQVQTQLALLLGSDIVEDEGRLLFDHGRQGADTEEHDVERRISG